MKKINYILFIVLLFTSLSACTEADKFEDALYFTGTEVSTTAKYSVDSNATPDIGITVTSSSVVKEELTIGVKTSPELLDIYNKKEGKQYKVLPESAYTLSSDHIIMNENQNISDPLKLSLIDMSSFEEGVTYCLPISMTTIKGGVSVLESSRTLYVVINQLIVTKAASIGASDGRQLTFRVPFENDESLTALPKVSMEARVYFNKFVPSFPYISTVIGIEENFLLRIGNGFVNNKMQLAGGGQQNEVTGSTQLQTNKWYHLAVVYDGAIIKLYVNGKLDGSISAARGPINLKSNSFFIGESCRNRYLDGIISEVRVWKRALTAQEVENNMCFVDNTYYDDLIAYWRFNEGAGVEKIKDWSGHGWDLNNTISNWKEGVRCPE